MTIAGAAATLAASSAASAGGEPAGGDLKDDDDDESGDANDGDGFDGRKMMLMGTVMMKILTERMRRRTAMGLS